MITASHDTKTAASLLPKRVHVIGICGVAMSALAVSFHRRGVQVTGSDKGFFPPVSTELERQGITFYAGWHPEKMFGGQIPAASDSSSSQTLHATTCFNPDQIVIVGTASGTQNPETARAKELGIPLLSYPEVLEKYFIKENSIVCAGTWGKTSSSALISFILDQAGLDPSYMFGGISLSHECSAKLIDSKWSVLEGDEYKSSPTDPQAKFFHYRPTHLLLSAVSWDHADLYPTENDYFLAFEKLVAKIPENGLIVACLDQPNVKKVLARKINSKLITYGAGVLSKSNDSSTLNGGAGNSVRPNYIYKLINQSEEGLDLVISHNNVQYHVHSPLIGSYQAENIAGCFALAHQIGISPEKIMAAISDFKGLKRRMEKRLDGTQTSRGITIIDDIAHSPEKAQSALKTLRNIFKNHIITVFEPNIGGRQREAAHKYDNAFADSDLVVIPRLTKLKIPEEKNTLPMEGPDLASIMAKTHKNTIYIDDDSKAVNFLASKAKKGDVIAFLGSHGFRGMIEETVSKLK